MSLINRKEVYGCTSIRNTTPQKPTRTFPRTTQAHRTLTGIIRQISKITKRAKEARHGSLANKNKKDIHAQNYIILSLHDY